MQPHLSALFFVSLVNVYHVKNMSLVKNWGSLTAPSISIGCALLQSLTVMESGLSSCNRGIWMRVPPVCLVVST